MSSKISWSLIIASMLIIGAGCGRSVPTPIDAVSNAKQIIDRASSTLNSLPGKDHPFEWKAIRMGVSRGEELRVADGWAERLIVYRFDPNVFSFKLVQSDSQKTIRAWRDEVEQALFVINGVYFHNDGSPVGSLRIDGRELSKSHFDADKSGIFELDGAPSIVDTSKNERAISASQTSAQSYPFLVKEGIASVAEDSHQLARRSFIGMDQDGYTYLGVFPDGEISLFDLSRRLQGLPIKWHHVLNLDGGPSTSFVSKFEGSEEVEDGFSTIPNVITVEIK